MVMKALIFGYFLNHSRVRGRSIHDNQLLEIYIPFIFLDGGGLLKFSSSLHFDVDSRFQETGTLRCHHYLETSSFEFRGNQFCVDPFH